MTETDAPYPERGNDDDPELTTDLTAALGTTSFFPPARDEPSYAVDTAEHEVSEQADERGESPLAYETSQYEERSEPFPVSAPDAPLAPAEPAKMPGAPGTAGAALADLASGYGGSYEPYYGTPSPWSSDRLEAIMRDTVDAQVQEQRQLETVLEDVRAALARIADTPAADIAGAVNRLAAELGGARAEQEQRFAELSARIDALAAPEHEQSGGPAAPSIQDLHDGLAGVRTDVASLPEQIGPAVTSAVAHGLAETTNQVGALRQSLADTVNETGELRSLVAGHAEHLGLLPEAVAGLQDLAARVASLEASGRTATDDAPGPDLTTVVDEQLAAHLERFGTDVTEQMNAVRAQIAAVEESLGLTVRERLGVFEERLDALHEVLVALHHSEERELSPVLVGRLDDLDDELRAMRLASEGPASPITSVVAQLHASEQRLAHHVDEAVLALAQAVLRRRAGGAATPHEEPSLPEDELAAAQRDDVHAATSEGAPDDVTALEPDEPAGDEADAEGTVGWEDEAGEAVEDDSGDADEDTRATLPDFGVQPGRGPSVPDPRRGLFRRRP